MTRKSLGILITYHNERELLSECLASLRASGEPDEIWVYDDASTERPDPWIPAGMTVRVIRGDVIHGPAYGRNRLLEACHCDFVHFQDSDDLFDPAWCLTVREKLDNSNVDAVFTEIATFQHGARATERVLNVKRLQTAPDLLDFCLKGPMLVPAGTYRRSLLQKIGGYRETLWQSEDFDFHVRLALQQPAYEVIDVPLIVQRLRTESRSQNTAQVWQSTIQAVTLLSKEIPGAYRSRLAEVAASAGSELFRHGARSEARAAFAIANRLGPPLFDKQWGLYRCVARTIGPMAAEYVALAYRKILPPALRNSMRNMGDRMGWHAKREGYF